MTLRYIRHIALALAFAAYAVTGAAAQEYVAGPVTISKEKVKVDGKICYSHIVEERQTLYSISKAYEVTIEDIYRFNPSLRETGLKKNSIIIIPSKEASGESQAATPKTDEPKANERKEERKPTVNKEDAATLTHVVRWYEDLESIAQKYGVSAEEIMTANGMTGKKLKNRQRIIIPEKGLYAKSSEIAAANSAEDEITDLENAFQDTADTDSRINVFTPQTHIKATVLLPLKATGNTSSRNNMDFYSGILLAAKDMAEEGIDIDLDVHDISAGNWGISRFALSQSDMTIGPVSAGDLTKTAGLVQGTDAIIISPLDPRAGSLVHDYGNLIQTPAAMTLQYNDMAAWITEDFRPGDKVIVISEKEARQNDAGKLMRAAIDSSSVSYIPFAYSILDGRTIQAPLENIMTQKGTNRIVIASESEAFVNDVVRNLNLIVHDKYDVVLYGPAKIRSFETIEVENFHNTSLHASLPYFIDYEDLRVKNFLLKYRALFHTEPTQFAYQGYDVAKYFFGMCAKYGKGWPRMLENEREDMLQSTFSFRHIQGGGYANEGIRRIIYGKDYSVVKIR